jgi:hypothetical protein
VLAAVRALHPGQKISRHHSLARDAYTHATMAWHANRGA